MSLLDVVRKGVKIADTVTKPLQATVSYYRYDYEDAYGTKYYVPDRNGPGTQLKAIVDWKQKQVRLQSGILSVTRASVMLLDVTEVAAATNGQGIDDNDVFVLPDGTTGPILDMSGFIDAGTGQPVTTEVLLG